MVESINGMIWVVNGQTVNVSDAEIEVAPVIGDVVTIDGYLDANGMFAATKVIFGTSLGDGEDPAEDAVEQATKTPDDDSEAEVSAEDPPDDDD
jgi:hypothetical protein